MPRLKHGASVLNLKLYRVFNAMKARCTSPKSDMFPIYGGRGICIGPEWEDNPRAFVIWALSNGYREGLTIDRIDVNGNYEPNNCRWVTVKEQSRNRQYNRYITFRGETRCVGEWAEITGIRSPNIITRLDRCGMSVEDALTIPPIRRKKLYRHQGGAYRAKDLAAKIGMSVDYVYRHFEHVGYAE